MLKGHKKNCQCFCCRGERGERFGINSSRYNQSVSRETRQKMRLAKLGTKQSEKHIRKRSKSLKQAYASGSRKCWNKDLTKETDKRVAQQARKIKDQIGPNKNREFSKDWKENIHKGMTKKWQDPIYRKQQIEAQIRGKIKHSIQKQNKSEKKLENLLSKILPNEYKYVGLGEVILAGKCPDFVNVNGQKKIIELYGDYWHKGETGEDRISLFKQYGYQTLIIWEHELENKELLENKVLQFNNI